MTRNLTLRAVDRFLPMVEMTVKLIRFYELEVI
jgi:hypothetical protein